MILSDNRRQHLGRLVSCCRKWLAGSDGSDEIDNSGRSATGTERLGSELSDALAGFKSERQRVKDGKNEERDQGGNIARHQEGRERNFKPMKRLGQEQRQATPGRRLAWLSGSHSQALLRPRTYREAIVLDGTGCCGQTAEAVNYWAYGTNPWTKKEQARGRI